MNWHLEVGEDALADIEAAAAWYERQQPGLGLTFSRSVRQAIDSLPANPLIYRLRDRRRNVRRIFSSQFPYRIAYRVFGDLISVFAVIHAARHDREWKRRR